MIQTDICIVGAGPVGLFAVFETGLLEMRCHLIDALPQVGGQLSELYPQKPIYDIPGHPSVLAGDLIRNLEAQIAPFKPTFTLGERVEQLLPQADGRFRLETNRGTVVEAKAVVIAGGLGSFEPRKPALEGLEAFEQKGVEYMVRDPEVYRGKRVVIAGGGDSALDWAMYLSELAAELHLIHRRDEFRGAPDSGKKVFDLAEAGKLHLHLSAQLVRLEGGDELERVVITDRNKEEVAIEADALIPLFGLSPKLGPIADWGLDLDKRQIKVDVETFETSLPGVYAIGDINTYPGKLKLILCGFHEAAMMAHSVVKRVRPDRKSTTMKYTTVTGISGF
ncbi:MAG: NAD(P)/FAD-dependent oxidoreductase [Bacteroidetes bacterium]|nr:MAG: NAD(P)/FAD-dependent oxidoreductase [Bacteroidota bacterium]